MRKLFLLFLPCVLTACTTQTSGDCPDGGASSTAVIGGMGTSGDPVVATYDGAEIKLSELDAEAKPAIVKAMLDIDRARNQTLEQMVFDHLVEAEAEAAGMDKDAYLKQEIEDKIEPVTDEVARAYFDENPPPGNRDFESVKPRLIAFLERKAQSERTMAFREELMDKHDVKLSLDPYRVEVSADDDPSKGPEDAPVTIIEFADFQCGYCSRSRQTTSKILETYGDQVRFVYRDFPIQKHPRAQFMAMAANCAGDQGKYWEYYDLLFDNQRKTSDDDLKAHAATLQLDAAAFAECYDSKKHEEEVNKDLEDGAAVGVSGTPAFFINGRMVTGAQPFEAFAQVIDDELERKGLTPPDTAASAAE